MDSPAWKSTLLGRLSFTKRERARRTGPLPSRKRLKASDMRKTGSCFLCHIHGEGVSVQIVEVKYHNLRGSVPWVNNDHVSNA